MPKGQKFGGRKKGTKNKPAIERSKRSLGREAYETLAQMDRSGVPMAQILLQGARYVHELAKAEILRGMALAQEPEPQIDQIRASQDRSVKLSESAGKLAKDAAAYLYPTLQAIRHSGDEDQPPIRVESLSDHQLEQLIRRLSRG